MATTPATRVGSICSSHGNDASRLLDILLEVQRARGCVDAEAAGTIARRLGIPRTRVEGVVGFYAFLSTEPLGSTAIRLVSDIVDDMAGAEVVGRVLEDSLGIRFGQTTADGRVTLERTSCIGMSDQAPAALVGDTVVPRLGTSRAREIATVVRSVADPAELRRRLVPSYGDGNNAHDLVRAAVNNNIRRAGPVVLAEMERGVALDAALALSPAEVIREIKTARLRGRGGAGFPTGMKWEFTRSAPGWRRTMICNADEGEPGTFKDRVILTEYPDLMFEGMTIGAYAIGANSGILYLRAEYAYLRAFLEHILERRRDAGLLGSEICGRRGFDFDIRIQMGAGAYVCGEETALINSCEGLRGEPRTRPPYPAQSGYMATPTSVNNVETLCCAARILERGSAWFCSHGSPASTGTKLLSISGDCHRPGVYEVPFGVPLRQVLEMCGGEDARGVQVGGPSGRMVGSASYDRNICFEDLATGGAMIVFGRQRDPVRIAARYMDFFADESCGVCTPCRVGTQLLSERLHQMLDGRGCSSDVDYLRDLCRTVRTTSRCGLGQTAPNPVLSTLDAFPEAYEAYAGPDGLDVPRFDLDAAVVTAASITGRRPGRTEGGSA